MKVIARQAWLLTLDARQMEGRPGLLPNRHGAVAWDGRESRRRREESYQNVPCLCTLGSIVWNAHHAPCCSYIHHQPEGGGNNCVLSDFQTIRGWVMKQCCTVRVSSECPADKSEVECSF